MLANLKTMLAFTIATFLVGAFATPAFAADAGSNPSGVWPLDWGNTSAWDGGVVADNNAYLGRRSDNVTPVNGVIVNLTDTRSVAFPTVRNDAILNITSTGEFSFAGNITVTENATLNISGKITHNQFLIQGNGIVNLLPGGDQTQVTAPTRIAQGTGQNVQFNISGGRYVANNNDFKIGEGGGTGTINQSAGLVRLTAADMEFWNQSGALGKWNLSGGQLAITGVDSNPLNYVEMTNDGQLGGIVLSGTGELYIRGDRTSDITLIDSSGDALLSGAVNAAFGNWVLSDSTNLTGYTKFTAAAEAVPEPTTLALGLIGLAGLGLLAWRRKRSIADC